MALAIGHLKPPQVRPLMLHALFAQWKARLRANTLNVYRLEALKICRLLETHGAPHINLPKAPMHQRATVATVEELSRILSSGGAHIRLFTLLYFQCGIRRAETLRVTPRSWNREQHTVTVKVKGGRTRTAQVTPDVEALFLAAGDPPPDQPFIHALYGRALSPNRLGHHWNAHRKRCGVRAELTPHDIRRTAATILYTATKDLRTAQQLLGHKSLVSTLAYLAPLEPNEARKYSELLRFEHFQSQVKQ